MGGKILKTPELRMTKNRALILRSLEKSAHPVTAEEIYFSFKEGKINLSTVYRTLNAFDRAGIVRREINNKKENVFSLARGADHHMLVCTVCHKRTPLEGCPYHEVNEAIEKETGFILNDQNVEIYGICPHCQKSEKNVKTTASIFPSAD